MQWSPFSALALAALFLATGVWHLLKPAFFLSITPRWVAWPRLANALATAAELMLVPALCSGSSRSWAAWGAVALLFSVVPVHIDMLRPGRGKGVPRAWLRVRLMLQGALILWALSLR